MTTDRWLNMAPLQAQSEIITEIAHRVLSDVGDSWQQVLYTIVRFGGQGTERLDVTGTDGVTRLARHWKTTFDLAEDLKRVMCVPGRGSWFAMTLTLRNGGSVPAKSSWLAM